MAMKIGITNPMLSVRMLEQGISQYIKKILSGKKITEPTESYKFTPEKVGPEIAERGLIINKSHIEPSHWAISEQQSPQNTRYQHEIQGTLPFH